MRKVSPRVWRLDRAPPPIAMPTISLKRSFAPARGAKFAPVAAPASVGQRTVKGARLRRRAAPLAEGFDPNRDPFRPLREGQHVAAADGAARLVDRSARLAAQEAHAAFLDDSRGQASRLEKAGAPQPDIDPAGVFRHEAARPAAGPRLRLRRRVRRSAGFVSAASAANGVAAGPALSVD